MRTIHSSTGVVGHRINAAPFGEPDNYAIAAPRVLVSYFCANHHEVRPAFSITAKIPEIWTCRCGQPSGQDPECPPPPAQFHTLRYPAEKSHMDYVRQRRSTSDGEALIDWALERMRARRESQRDQAARTTTGSAVVHGAVPTAALPAAPELVVLASPIIRRQPRRLSRRQRSKRQIVPSQMGHLVS